MVAGTIFNRAQLFQFRPDREDVANFRRCCEVMNAAADENVRHPVLLADRRQFSPLFPASSLATISRDDNPSTFVGNLRNPLFIPSSLLLNLQDMPELIVID